MLVVAEASQIRALAFPDHAGVTVALALALVLKHGAGFRQLMRYYENFATVGGLAELRRQADLLPDGEFMCWHAQRSLANPVKVPLSHVPIAVIAVIATVEIRMAIKAYSIAVAPVLSRNSAGKWCRIFID